MEINVKKLLAGGVTEPQWVEFEDGAEFSLLPSRGDDQQRHLGDDAKPAAVTRYWLGKIKDWRGVTSGGQPVQFDEKLLRAMWDQNPFFRSFVVRESQQLARFRGELGSAPPVPALASEQG